MHPESYYSGRGKNARAWGVPQGKDCPSVPLANFPARVFFYYILRKCKKKTNKFFIGIYIWKDAGPCHVFMPGGRGVVFFFGVIQNVSFSGEKVGKKFVTLLDLCVSSLRRGHANLLCIVPILTDDLRRGSILE